MALQGTIRQELQLSDGLSLRFQGHSDPWFLPGNLIASWKAIMERSSWPDLCRHYHWPGLFIWATGRFSPTSSINLRRSNAKPFSRL
jgi:hypothetical protein